jgi:hypothetical protein
MAKAVQLAAVGVGGGTPASNVALCAMQEL